MQTTAPYPDIPGMMSVMEAIVSEDKPDMAYMYNNKGELRIYKRVEGCYILIKR